MRSAFVLLSIALIVMSISVQGQEHTAEYWLQKGDEFFNKGSYELAANCYDKCLELDSKNVSAWSQKGLALANINKYNESMEAINTAITLDPRDANSWITKGRALYIIAKNNESLDNINETSEHFGPKDNYTFVLELNGSVGHKKVWEYLFGISKGAKRITAGLNKAGTDSVLLFLLENPHGEPADAALGTGNLGPIEVIAPEPGQWKIKVYGYDVPKDEQVFHINLINQSHLSNRYNESLEAFDKAIELDPKSIAALNFKALALYDSHRINEAIELVDKSLKIDPLNAGAWLVKGQIFNKQGKNEDALQYFSNAIDLDPSYADAWLNKANVLKSLGRTDEANAALSKWVELVGYNGPSLRYS